MISVIIPAYKNTEELIKNLRSNFQYLTDCEVIIVNDDPEKSIKKDCRDFDLKLIENEKNMGFGGAVNTGVRKAKGEYILLLNSDVELNDASFKKSVKHLENNKQLFGVAFAQKESSGSIVGKNKIFWNFGLLHHSKADDMKNGPTAWIEGGAGIFDKKKFLKLEGFDPLYSPFYWEDIDLSYRAWKAGYELLFDSSVMVNHNHESTIGKYFEKKMVKETAFRNQHIFIMKNITDFPLSISYWILLIFNMIYYLIKKESGFATGFFEASSQFMRVTRHRTRQQKYFVLQDSKILMKFHD